jgi:tRNA A37 threonylcarbamoyladenosine dehydratase
MGIEKGIFQRTELLLGKSFIEKAFQKRVIIFGIGGVGSWCAESLVRSGINQLTIVDSDRVCVTNVNRQLLATTKTVGKVKTEVLKERLLEINPKAEITALQKIYSPETSESFELDTYDYIIDAIDSLSNKVHLIQTATKTKARFFSSMGAALRSRLKKMGGTSKKFMCVYSDELLKNKGENAACGTEKCLCPKALEGPGDPDLVNHEWCSLKAQVNGTTSYMPAMFGMTIAGLVIQSIEKEEI